MFRFLYTFYYNIEIEILSTDILQAQIDLYILFGEQIRLAVI